MIIKYQIKFNLKKNAIDHVVMIIIKHVKMNEILASNNP